MQKLNDYKWSLMALAFILGGLLLSRGGMATLAPLAKILAPVILIVMALNFVKRRLTGGAIGEAVRKKVEEAMRQQQQGQAAGGRGDKVIDLCPKCGSYLAAGHRCKK